MDEIYERARRELESLWWLDKAIDSRIAHCQQLREKISNLSASGTNEPVSGTKLSDIADGVAKLVDYEQELQREIQEYIDRRKCIVLRIHTLPNSAQANVLYYHYVLGMSDTETANKMGYVVRHIKRLRQDGLMEYGEKFCYY